MQIKSWQIALVGNIIQILYTIQFVISTFITLQKYQTSDFFEPAFASKMFMQVVLLGIVIILILFGLITFLLYKNNPRLGAILSISFSLAGIYFTISYPNFIFLFIPFLIAGIYFFKIENKRQS